MQRAIRRCREIGVHLLGKLPLRMHATCFLIMRLQQVSNETVLHVLASNLPRVIDIMGAKPNIAAMMA